jgi:transcriptional regulator GlxA family with amidase domain
MFDQMEELDAVGPWEVFGFLATERPDLCRVFSASETGARVVCARGLKIEPDFSFRECPEIDVLIVPGGDGRRRETENPVMIDFVKRAAQRARIVASVCTGSFILERAGLLVGKRATTYWGRIDEFRSLGTVDVVHERWVDNGSVMTAAGVSAGIDMSLAIVGKLFGEEIGRFVQRGIEYDPEPPYSDS